MRNLTLKILVALAALVWAGSGTGREPMDIEEFVRQVYIHGVPYEEANKYGAPVVPTLLKMLKDPKEQDHWSNIVVTLGMIGDESAVEPMIEFIEEGKKGTPSRSRRKAMGSAVTALGYLINKSGSRKALDYLIKSLTPQARAEGFLAAITDLFGTTAEWDKDLSKYAVMGLALSGHPRAATALKSIRKPPKSSDDRAAKEMIDEALRTNKEIADKGLAEYYRESRP